VSDVHLEVEAGKVTGLLGPNGAGKTTLLRAILDLVHPTQGVISIDGISSRDSASRDRLTYLPGDLVLPPRLTGRKVVQRFNTSRLAIDWNYVDELSARLELNLDRPVGQLSKGNRQKVGLLLAFAPKSTFMILDEPTSGLDPILQKVFVDMVREQTRTGATVLLSSHVLSELEHLADDVVVLREGRLVAHESIAHLRARARQVILAWLADEASAQRCAEAMRHQGVSEVHAEGSRVRAVVVGSPDRVIKALAGFSIERLVTEGSDLAEVFLDFYQPVSGGDGDA
jgi:ABC-2 type transport system ATP-binding protein